MIEIDMVEASLFMLRTPTSLQCWCEDAGWTWGDVEGVLPWWRSEGVCGGAFEFRRESTCRSFIWWHCCRNTKKKRINLLSHERHWSAKPEARHCAILRTDNDLCVNMLLVIPMHFCKFRWILFVYFLVHHSYISFDFSFFVCTIKLYKTTGSIVLDNI